MEDLLALHAQHFPQLRQALATLDADYVRRKASGEIERHLREERRHIVEGFLAGLAEDFGRLERLMTVVREMSPAEPWIHQFRRIARRFRFRVNYRIASTTDPFGKTAINESAGATHRAGRESFGANRTGHGAIGPVCQRGMLRR